MTHDEMQHGLNALKLALASKGFPDDGDGPRLYIGLRDSAVLFCQRDYRSRIVRGRTPEAALAEAANWVAAAELWTAQDVARTLQAAE